jgi:large subunit ribosomal protein L18e
MKSKTHLERKMGKKTDPLLVETLILAKQHPAWDKVAHRLANSTRQHASINLSALEEVAKEGDTFVILGSLLGSGTLSKKIRICALRASQTAREKLKDSKSEMVSIKEEIIHNPTARGVKVVG